MAHYLGWHWPALELRLSTVCENVQHDSNSLKLEKRTRYHIIIPVIYIYNKIDRGLLWLSSASKRYRKAHVFTKRQSLCIPNNNGVGDLPFSFAYLPEAKYLLKDYRRDEFMHNVSGHMEPGNTGYSCTSGIFYDDDTLDNHNGLFCIFNVRRSAVSLIR